ncbi:hypothetical protein [Hyalangium versicolor]|uniref:hypothetical protein n=1 Tax=Hyalangium versicolor TaxID=2861190 RepID=UPI001CCD7251|nr:hypothetical protein [Hyalangium versicolor]
MNVRRLLTSLIAFSAITACGPADVENPATAELEQSLCAQSNYLTNPTFNTVGPNGTPTTVTTAVAGGAGNSAAANWTLFTNTPGTVFTELLPSSRNDGTRMIHVRTQGPGNGLVQVFQPFNTGPTQVISGAWIYVLSGRVCIGTGNGGNTGCDAYSSTTGQWQYVTASNGVIPANEFIIYSTTTTGADFYVDEASVQFSPNLLANPTFATVGPNGSLTSVTTSVPGSAGWSAAANWSLFTNNPGLITSRLEPSTLPGGVNMLHVITHADRNGVVQVFPGANSCTANGPAHVLSGAYVYVNSGQVCIGTGNGGNTSCNAFSTTTGQWQWLQAPNANSPANEFIVYAASTAGADYFVGFARVTETP